MAKTQQPVTTDIFDYILSTSLREPDVMRRLREKTNTEHEFSGMLSAPEQMQFIALLIKLMNAKKAIEVGGFVGYGSLAIAQALASDGELITCDMNEAWLNIGKPFWQEANVAHKITIKLGKALASLNALLEQHGQNSYDFVYIDADKSEYDDYYELCLQLVRPGGLIVFDNMLWAGDWCSAYPDTPGAKAINALNKKLHHDERVDISLVPVAAGMMLARKC